ncbi:MAG: N-acetyltransferase, partial [Alphaproteobacteria bacterium]
AGQLPELGYWLGEPHWGKGYMSEAVKALLEAVFATGLYPRLQARALKSNVGSLNVLEKAGFKRTGEGPDTIGHSGGATLVFLELEQPKWT